ncbi:hypothetical protein LIER_13777 [Lithospermum erythrorhizon]|uniref:DUF4283 domain-containing protein n=1 Tax=Lithospermum erythrorhizon TaxID=34254 RepID=A0AAV3PZ64_LITER
MMVKPRSDEVSIDGGGSYLAIEKTMKRKKKRKGPPPDGGASDLVASNADPSLLVRVPCDNRVNVDAVLDKKLQKNVEQWGLLEPSHAAKGSCDKPEGNCVVKGGLVAPQAGHVVASCSETRAVSPGAGGDKTQAMENSPMLPPVSSPLVDVVILGYGSVTHQSAKEILNAPQIADGNAVGPKAIADGKDVSVSNAKTVPVFGVGSSSAGLNKDSLAGQGLVFKVGGTGSGPVAQGVGSNGRKTKAAGVMLHRAKKAFLSGPGVSLGAASTSNRPNPPTIQSVRPEAEVPGAVPAGPTKGAQVRPTFSDVIKDNRLVGNGFKLEHYDLMENEDDVILDESDEIPFVETWGYCLIGCFTGPFPGRQALNSLVNSWNVKCRIIPYAKGWTVFRFMSDEDRFKVFNGGPYLAFGKTLMLRLVDAGVIIGDDLFTSVPTWVLFHDVPLSVWSESGLSKIASKVGIPMYTDKFTKERTKMSYARCLVDVDVSKPPVMEFGVKLSGGRRYTQKVTYECYPDYCCDCKKFGHNIFKCPKKTKVVETPVVPSPAVPNVDPVPTRNPVPVVNPKPVLPPKVFRPKTRVKTHNNASHKASLPKASNNIANGALSKEIESVDMVTSPSNKGNGSKKMDKGKAIASQIPMVSPNSFEALNNMGGTSGTHDEDVSNVQMGDLIPSALDNADHEGGVWQHVIRKGSPNGRGGAVSSFVSQCG